MNIQQSYHHSPFDSKFCHVIKSRNELEISRIDYLMDTQKGQLVIFLESTLFFEQEVNALVKGSNLIIEALRSMEYEKPLKTHLIDKHYLLEMGKGILTIGFSEVQLKQGYRYTVLSCHMINPGLFKVILSFHKDRKNLENTIN